MSKEADLWGRVCPILTAEERHTIYCIQLPTLIFPPVVAFEHLLKGPRLPVAYLIALAVAYGLTVVEGVYEIRPFDAQALQTIRILRIMLSQSFFGAVILAGLIFMLRKNYGENPGQANDRNDNASR